MQRLMAFTRLREIMDPSLPIRASSLMEEPDAHKTHPKTVNQQQEDVRTCAQPDQRVGL